MFKRGKIIGYDAAKRTAQVHIFGLTDGASDGLTATFAYPVGDDDRDTERQIINGNEVYIFFENGDQARPVIAFFSSHGQGAVVDVRRIRQKNIEILATAQATIDAPTIYLKGDVVIDGNLTHNGNTSHNGNLNQSGSQSVSGSIVAAGVKAGGVSLQSHRHSRVKAGLDDSGAPF